MAATQQIGRSTNSGNVPVATRGIRYGHADPEDYCCRIDRPTCSSEHMGRSSLNTSLLAVKRPEGRFTAESANINH